MQALGEVDGIGITLSVEQLHNTFAKLKKCNKRDADGISCKILCFFSLWLPERAVLLFNELASSNTLAREVFVVGHCAAKSKGSILPHKSRCILPFPSLWRPIDQLLGQDLKSFLDNLFITTPFY